MGAPYAQDLRERILAAYDRGMSTKPIAQLFCVSPAWTRRVKQRRRESGQITHKPMGDLRLVKISLQRLRELVAQQPDATTRELHRRLACGCCESAVGMALKRLGLTFKKRRCMPATRIAPTSSHAAPTGRTSSPAARRSV
jgi:transposase